MDGHVRQHDWIDQRVYDLYDEYCHGRIDRRAFLKHTAQELLDKLIPAGMACAAAYKVSDAMANPHTKARGAVIEVDYPGIGPVKSANNPIKLSDAPVEVRRKSPMIGQHTVEIMREVGYSDGEIAALKEAKAIAGT